jgi:hypothetical protein
MQTSVTTYSHAQLYGALGIDGNYTQISNGILSLNGDLSAGYINILNGSMVLSGSFTSQMNTIANNVSRIPLRQSFSLNGPTILRDRTAIIMELNKQATSTISLNGTCLGGCTNGLILLRYLDGYLPSIADSFDQFAPGL